MRAALFLARQKIVGAFRLFLSALKWAREDESATRAGKARWKPLGILKMRGHA